MSATASAIKPAGPEGVSRTQLLKERLGVGLRNSMKVARKFASEDVHITGNAIIPVTELCR